MQALDLVLHPDEADEAGLRRAVARALGVSEDRLTAVLPQRRVIDARRGQVRVRYAVHAFVDETPPAPRNTMDLPDLKGDPSVVIVGAGPAGLFCAWQLARLGVRSVLLERGADVRGRRPALARLNREGVLDPESNYCFGEGGAGTFSDGKLYTRATKRGPVLDVLAALVDCGADARILYDARPHIGTNKLPKVVIGLRERLIAAGVDVRFGARVDSLLTAGERVTGVRLADGSTLPAQAVVLATGHSARDVYRMCHRQGVALSAKPFALGVRVEHPQPIIDRIQYGKLAGHPNLGAAPYSLKRTVEAVGTFSFCMCPGGFIVAAATEADGVVVNGMSPSTRNGRFANSGMVVGVGPELFGEGPLAGLAWQAEVERAAFQAGGGAFKAPAQRLTDFLAGRSSADLPDCSYRPGLTPVDLRAVLPKPVARHLADSLRFFGERRMRGYTTREAVLVGVESRSSSPVRIERDPERLESPTLAGLYPSGEGAGFAGGIVSAALDGMRIAEAIVHAR
ncbi:MAG: FAD-binding protein [Myxococcales bacterium]|nr:FAD-binding protein [Myxococcales bacterium]